MRHHDARVEAGEIEGCYWLVVEAPFGLNDCGADVLITLSGTLGWKKEAILLGSTEKLGDYLVWNIHRSVGCPSVKLYLFFLKQLA